MKRSTTKWIATTALVMAGVGAGCAAATPPAELVAARAAFRKASDGPAAKLTPAELETARQALVRAEKAFENDEDAPETLDLAYVAERRAKIAEARGEIAEAEKDRARAEARARTAEQKNFQEAQSKLMVTGQELARAKEELAAEKVRADSEKKRAEEHAATAEAERQARMEAEKKAEEAMQALAKNMAVKKDQRGTVITLPGAVLFSSGKYELLAGAQSKLDDVADALKQQSDHKVIIEGHTDSKGKPEANEVLSLKRAEAVRAHLISRGVHSDQVKAVGVGPSRPIADNATSEGRASNRRVEIIIEPAAGGETETAPAAPNP